MILARFDSSLLVLVLWLAGSGTIETSGQDSVVTGGDSTETVTGVPGAMRFNFAYAPWKVVLEEFAKSAGLSLVLDAPPPGTFNYTDGKPYSPAEAIDLMNSVLLTKGFTLVRREKMLMVINVEDGVPPDLLTTTTVERLDEHGKFELARCLFPLRNITPEAAEEEVRKMIGRQGTIEVLPQSKQLLVTETGGRLRIIRDTLARIESPETDKLSSLVTYELRYIAPNDALAVLRQMLGLPEGQNSDADGQLRLAVSPVGRQIVASGKAAQQVRIKHILQLIDVASQPTAGLENIPQLEVYAITAADAESVLKVVQTLFSDDDQIRLATDPQTGNLVALAKPSQHATIRATLEQMQKDGHEIEVIALRTVDPEVAVQSINKLFGADDADQKNAPKVEADISGGHLMIRATRSQIADVRKLLHKLGESDETDVGRGRGNLRLLAIPAAEAQAILEQASLIWPNLRVNRIRTIAPANAIRARSPRAVREHNLPNSGRSPEPRETPDPQNGVESPSTQRPERTGSAGVPTPNRWTVAQASADESSPPRDQPDATDGTDQPASGSAAQSPTPPEVHSSEPGGTSPGADIIVAPGPKGLMISSADIEALDAFEDLVMSLADRAGATADKGYTVYYLRFEKAGRAAGLLNDVLGQGSGKPAGSSGGTLLGDLAGAALGDSGGGIVGSLLGLGSESGGKVTASGAVNIVANHRLNCLIVEAKPKDLDLIEQLLEVIDQPQSPEPVRTLPAPRLIPVFHVGAQEIETVIRSVYADRIAGGGGQPEQPRPEDIIRALRGGRGQGDSSSDSNEVKPDISIGVDQRNNALVVAAADPAFEEIKNLVHELDRADGPSSEATRVIAVKRVNPTVLQRALAALVASPESAVQPESAATPGARPEGSSDRGRARNARQPRDDDFESQLRQRAEFFRALQEQRERAQNEARPNRAPAERRAPDQAEP